MVEHTRWRRARGATGSHWLVSSARSLGRARVHSLLNRISRQLPHVLAIATLHRTEYSQAGINLLPVGDRECALTSWEMVFVNLLLLPMSLLPAVFGMSGKLYVIPAAVLGILYLFGTVGLALNPTKPMAGRLLRLSVLYLPLLLAAMVIC
jgi:heme o synthase